MNPDTNASTGVQPTSDSPMRSPPSPPLQRGKACLACRRRKIKCDGSRPICTPCLRGERTEDCEYTDSTRRPRTLLLEEDIARLRARVQELENPEEASPPIGLYDPYTGGDAGASSAPSSSTSAIHAQAVAPSPVSFHHAIRRRQAPSPGQPSGAYIVTPHSSQSLTQVLGSVAEPSRVDVEGDAHARRALSVIAPYAAELGFFLNPDRLRLQGTRILPALQSVLTLWLFHITAISDHDPAQTRERTTPLRSVLLSNAQTQLASALNAIDSEPDPAVCLQVIQTGVLLAYYMQRVGQVVGAGYYASGTWALVMLLKLYRHPDTSSSAGEGDQTPPASRMRRGVTPENAGTGTTTHLFDFAGCGTRLAPPLDKIEAEERVRAFWAAYALDRWFSVVCKAPGQSLAIDENVGHAVTVQWPGVQGMDKAEPNVIQRFLNDANHDFAQKGAAAMHASASVLLGEAMRLAASFLADHTISQTTAFRTRFATVDTLLQRCSSAATTMASGATHRHQPSLTEDQAQAFVTVHILALAQTVLHRPWMPTYVPSRRRCVEAALVVVRVLDELGDVVGTRVGSVGPTCAVVWTALCLALHDEVLRLRTSPDADPSRRHEGDLIRAIQKLVGILGTLSQHCPTRFFAANIEAVLPVLESITG